MNLPIPDAALDLGVSETRLRKTLASGAFATDVEYRQTRTGVRKTVMLSPATMAALHRHYRALEQSGLPAPTVPASAWLYPPADNPADAEGEDDYPACPQVRESAEEAAYLEQKSREKQRLGEGAGESVPPARELSAGTPVGAEGGVALAQFNALLYQHNVLREDLGRLNTYLSDCDHLLEEMIKTIVTLEARLQQLEARPAPARSSLSGALRSVSQGVARAFSRTPPGALRPAPKPREVYYANVLSRP